MTSRHCEEPGPLVPAIRIAIGVNRTALESNPAQPLPGLQPVARVPSRHCEEPDEMLSDEATPSSNYQAW